MSLQRNLGIVCVWDYAVGGRSRKNMMLRHLLVCIFVLAALQTSHAVAADLSSCDASGVRVLPASVPPSYTQSPYRLRFWVTSYYYMSGSTEAVGVASHAGIHEMILVEERKGVDPKVADPRFKMLMQHYPTARSPATTLYVSRISERLYEKLDAEWDRTVRDVRQEPMLMEDGAEYVFRTDDGGCAVANMSPPEGRVFDLMVLAGDMQLLAKKQAHSVSLRDEAPLMQDLSRLAPPGHAYYLKNIRSFMLGSDLTALVHIHSSGPSHDPGIWILQGQAFHEYDVHADVIERFHGKAGKAITFSVILPDTESPPSDENVIVSLTGNSKEGYRVMDDSMLWTRPTPDLLNELRRKITKAESECYVHGNCM